MLHLFDLTECHIQSVRIPSSTCSSASVCVFVLHQIVSQWEKKKIISVRLIWWAVNFRVTTLGLGKVEHRGSFYTIVFNEYAIVAQLYFPIDVTNNFLFYNLFCIPPPHTVSHFQWHKDGTQESKQDTLQLSQNVLLLDQKIIAGSKISDSNDTAKIEISTTQPKSGSGALPAEVFTVVHHFQVVVSRLEPT